MLYGRTPTIVIYSQLNQKYFIKSETKCIKSITFSQAYFLPLVMSSRKFMKESVEGSSLQMNNSFIPES